METPRRRILLATDLSPRCDRALDRAVALARDWSAELVVVHALGDGAPDAEAEALAQRRLREDLNAQALPVRVVVAREGAAALVGRTAEALQCELVLTGVARDEPLGRFFVGNTVEQLLRQTRVPVLVVRRRPHAAYRKLLVATDFSPGSLTALDTALRLWPRASVRALHGFTVPFESHAANPDASRARIREELEGVAATFIAGRQVPVLLEYGRPERALRQLEDAGESDLTVLGTEGRSGLAGLLLGSVATRVVAELRGDVLVVPHGRG